MGTTHIKRQVTLSALAAAFLMTAGGTAVRTADAQEQRSLYARLGGVYSIATVVDDFIERLLVNATLNANPAINEARARVPKAGLKFHVTALVCEVTGGPCKYSGRTMKEAHQHLNITQAQWDAMVADFRTTLDTFKVPQAEQQELITIVGSTKKDIVRPSASEQ
jgi:hemoglobin